MNIKLAHRGPDDDGLSGRPGICLGQRRLSIIDLSQAGHQPMKSACDRYTLVYNGEIYNYKNLRRQLDYPYKSKTDSEVLLAAYIKWGEDCLQHFNGMFAFAIWDEKREELFLARDRLGIKPLYTWTDGCRFVFSSEIRSLTKAGLFKPKLCKEGLVDYLRYQTVHEPMTILDGVNMLEAGSYMRVVRNQAHLGFAKKRYWKLNESRADVGSDFSDGRSIQDLVREKLQTAIERRLIADVPFGAFLSGGIDSSAVVGMMSRVSGSRIKTFNVSFSEEAFSEAPYARMVAKKFNTEHHETHLSPSDFLGQIPSALSAMDHPSGDGLNTWIVAKATREAGIKMALSGLGGDELFAGYSTFAQMRKLWQNRWVWKIPQSFRKMLSLALLRLRPSVTSNKIASLLSHKHFNFAEIYSISRRVFLDKQVVQMMGQEAIDYADLSCQSISNKTQLKQSTIYSAVSIAEISTYMKNVLLRDVDQMSMAHALEVRIPFLDHELVELLLSLSDQCKHPLFPKKLLIESLGDLLPNEIVNRPKMGFTFPWKYWLKNELYAFANAHIRNFAQRSLFNEQAILNVWTQFNKGDPRITFSRIWLLVVLDHWLRENGIEC